MSTNSKIKIVLKVFCKFIYKLWSWRWPRNKIFLPVTSSVTSFVSKKQHFEFPDCLLMWHHHDDQYIKSYLSLWIFAVWVFQVQWEMCSYTCTGQSSWQFKWTPDVLFITSHHKLWSTNMASPYKQYLSCMKCFGKWLRSKVPSGVRIVKLVYERSKFLAFFIGFKFIFLLHDS